MISVLIVMLGVVVTVYKIKKWKKISNHIPGPMFGWPVLGHLPYLQPSNLYANMSNMEMKYGPIFKLQLGSLETVVISDYKLIKKAFKMPELALRPNNFFLSEFASLGFHGLFSSNGELWNEQRRFAIRNLRDLGMGKASIETHIQREALAMVDHLRTSVGQPIDLNNSLNIAITNIVWAIVAGQRMKHDDPVFLGFMTAIRNNLEIGAAIGVVGFVPWLRKILPKSWIGLNLMEERLDIVYSYFKDVISAHRNVFNEHDLKDYTDYFLAEQKCNKENTTFTDVQLIVSMGDLFVAGGETTATTLRWGVLLLAYHCDVQIKMQNEIDAVVGRERLPTFSDREMMPYTDAVIHEIQRFADITPTGAFHSVDKDVLFEGYIIPKDALVMGYVGGIHRSKEYWVRPNEFYPEHFLDENGLLRKNVDGFLPFSTGKRQCIGENLAKAELFIFITYFFQNFKFSLSQTPKPSLDADPSGGIFRWPSPYRIIVDSR